MGYYNNDPPRTMEELLSMPAQLIDDEDKPRSAPVPFDGNDPELTMTEMALRQSVAPHNSAIDDCDRGVQALMDAGGALRGKAKLPECAAALATMLEKLPPGLPREQVHTVREAAAPAHHHTAHTAHGGAVFAVEAQVTPRGKTTPAHHAAHAGPTGKEKSHSA